jgi:hypothetical protein
MLISRMADGFPAWSVKKPGRWVIILDGLYRVANEIVVQSGEAGEGVDHR